MAKRMSMYSRTAVRARRSHAQRHSMHSGTACTECRATHRALVDRAAHSQARVQLKHHPAQRQRQAWGKA